MGKGESNRSRGADFGPFPFKTNFEEGGSIPVEILSA